MGEAAITPEPASETITDTASIVPAEDAVITISKPNPNPDPLPPPRRRAPLSCRKMSSKNNHPINGIIAIVTYLTSLPLLGYGIWLLATRDFICEDLLHMPSHLRSSIGIGLVVVFAASCLFTHYGARILYPGALALALLFLAMLIMGIASVGSYAMESRGFPMSPVWIRHRMAHGDTWRAIKTCIFEARTCQDLSYGTAELINAEEFAKKRLSPIESGCCKPPDLCGMEYVNATNWIRAAENVTMAANSTVNPKTYGDCQAYSNIDTLLCYDCYSCKEGFLKSIRHHWKKLGAFLITMSVLLIVIHTVRFIVNMMEENKS